MRHSNKILFRKVTEAFPSKPHKKFRLQNELQNRSIQSFCTVNKYQQKIQKINLISTSPVILMQAKCNEGQSRFGLTFVTLNVLFVESPRTLLLESVRFLVFPTEYRIQHILFRYYKVGPGIIIFSNEFLNFFHNPYTRSTTCDMNRSFICKFAVIQYPANKISLLDAFFRICVYFMWTVYTKRRRVISIKSYKTLAPVMQYFF